MKFLNNFKCALVFGLVMSTQIVTIATMHAADNQVPTQQQVEAYDKDVSGRMKSLFDALMIDSRTAKLKKSAAEDLRVLFCETLPAFYKTEFDQYKTTEDLNQDWPDNSYLDKLFSAAINNIMGFCRWAMRDILRVYGGQEYRINLTGTDPISLFFQEISTIESRVRIQKGGAAQGVTRLAYWVEEINKVWSMPDMPDFDFNFGAEEGQAGSGARFQGQQGGMPFYVISGKGVIFNQGQLGVKAEANSKTEMRFEAGANVTVHLDPKAKVTLVMDSKKDEKGKWLKWADVRNFILGAAGWTLIECTSEEAWNYETRPTAALFAFGAGALWTILPRIDQKVREICE